MKSLNLLLLCLSLATQLVQADQASAEAQVTAKVVSGCKFIGNNSNTIVGRIDFGEHRDLSQYIESSTLESNNRIEIQCTPGLTYQVTLSAGMHSQGSGERRMFSSFTGQHIAYQLFRDSARSYEWTPGQPLTRQANGLSESIAIYGRVNTAAITPQAGNYSDRITMVISF